MCCCCTLFSCHKVMGFLSRSSSKKSKKSAKSESVYEQVRALGATVGAVR